MTIGKKLAVKLLALEFNAESAQRFLLDGDGIQETPGKRHGVLRGDFGTSIVQTRRPVTEVIGERLPNTLLLMGIMLIVTLLVAIPLGILSAIKQYTWFDHITTTLAFAGQSLPVFWFGLLLIIIFAVTLKGADGRPLLPGSGMSTLGQPFSLADRIKHLILPVTMLAFVSAAGYMRYLRSSMLDVIHEDYIRTARAKGLPEGTVLFKHVLRNAMIPILTNVAVSLPGIFVGSFLIEVFFSIPGLGREVLLAVNRSDYPVIQGVILFFSAVYLVVNLLVDLSYGLLDPRIRFS